MSNENPSTPSTNCRCDYVAAFLVLRVFLGLRTLMAGVEKFESKGAYSFANHQANMERMADGITSASFMPLWMTRAFAYPLGYILLILGLMILLGVKTRMSLVASGMLYVGLSFGLMAVQEQAGTAWLATYIGLFAGALALSRYDRFAVLPDKN